MMMGCNGFPTQAGGSRSSSIRSYSEMMSEGKVNDKDLHDWRFRQNHLLSFHQNNHPLSYAMNRNKVSIEPRIVNGIYVSPPEKYSFMGALRPFLPLDVYHSKSYGSICFIIILTIHVLND